MKYLVGVTWREIVEHYGSIEVEAEDEEGAKEAACLLNDQGLIEFKVIDGDYHSGPDYEIMTPWEDPQTTPES